MNCREVRDPGVLELMQSLKTGGYDRSFCVRVVEITKEQFEQYYRVKGMSPPVLDHTKPWTNTWESGAYDKSDLVLPAETKAKHKANVE